MSTEILHATVSGTGPDVVLLHPVGLDGTFWGGLIERLAQDRRVIAIDQRGHGRSPAARPGATMADYVADTARTLDALGVKKAAMVGLSFGGMLAQEFTLALPDRVTALVPCGCPGAMPEAAGPMIRERGLAAERDGMGAILEATIERWFTPAFRSEPAVARVRERLLSDDVAGWSGAWHAIAGFDALSRLGTVRVPALVVSGEQDAATPVAASRTLAEAIPGAELAVLSGASHMMQFEGGAAFRETVAGFLAKVGAR